MTPSLFDLPLRIGDASALAAILIDCAGTHTKPITPDIRNRVSARLGALKFESLKSFPASLERDPTHPSALYICVDGIDRRPLLLRVAPASTPSSGLFPNAILIGRTRVGPIEIVLNAVPFGPADHDRIRAFSEIVNRAFLPRNSSAVPPTVCDDIPAAFAGFREILKTTGRNQAVFAVQEGQDSDNFRFEAIWSAIRAGWREGYSIVL